MVNDLDKFYSEDDPEVWKKILGKDLHYHHGYRNPDNSEEDPMEFAIRELYPLIKKKSTILDCGAGWGGPAKMFRDELDCDVTCLTISNSQSKYLASLNFKVIQQDFDNYIPDKHYDYAIFIESICHSKDQQLIYKNLWSNVDHIIIRDYFTDDNNGYEFPDFKMRVSSLKNTAKQLKLAGYKPKLHSLQKSEPFIETINYWKKNLEVNKNIIKGEHLNILYEYIVRYKDRFKHTNVYKNRTNIIKYLGTIYGTR